MKAEKIKLYPKQKECCEKLLKQFKRDNKYNCLFLSGEMGVGKTYMSSYILNYYKKDNGFSILIAPSNVHKKFQNVLGNDLIKYKKDIKFENNKIYLFSYRTLSSFINKLKENQNEYKKFINNVNLIVVDESQELSFANIEFLHEVYANKKDLKILNLTGTIFDSSFKKLRTLLVSFYKEVEDIDFSNLFEFCSKLWKYISVSISLDDLKDNTILNNKDDIQQKIMPIELIDVSEEEYLFYKLIKSQIGNFYSKNTKEIDEISNSELLASSYLDFPEKELYVNKRNKLVDKIYSYTDNIFSLPLTNKIKIKDTNKYKKLKEILKDNKKQRTLIYITDDEFSQYLNKQLNEDNFSSININSKNNIDEKINNAFNEYNIIIVNPKLIKVGVDIKAENIVWYQLLSKTVDILQAQRRITRLNSKTESKIYYLGYNNTTQQKMLETISNNAKNNAASYGFKDKSNLAQFTGILLEQLK